MNVMECFRISYDQITNAFTCVYLDFALIYNVLKPSAAVSQSFIIKRKSESCVAPPVCFSRAKSVEPVTSQLNDIISRACILLRLLKSGLGTIIGALKCRSDYRLVNVVAETASGPS